MITILSTIIIGLIIGVVAKLLMPGPDSGGFILTTLLGVGGSFAASYLGQVLGWYQHGQPAGFVASILGAMLILYLYRCFKPRSSSHSRS